MIRLSINVLSASISLLQKIEQYPALSVAQLLYARIMYISVEDILSFSQNCGWIFVKDDNAEISPRGAEILRLNHSDSLFTMKREMLMDYVLRVSPIWCNRIPYGRKEASIFMTKDERACFTEAHLLSEELDDSIIDWWDMVSSQIRKRSQEHKNQTGRMGEHSTILYEYLRTGTKPQWASIDSNLLGYDIVSRLDRNDITKLLIEVKASTSNIAQADFHVSAQEWTVAKSSSQYAFYLWSFADNKKWLARITPTELAPYMPTNNSYGKWESAQIPFFCFAEKFAEITLGESYV